MAELTVRFPQVTTRRVLIVMAGLGLSVAIAVGTIVYLRQNTAVVGLPVNAYKDLAFTVFFPRHPPQGFKFDDNSVSSRSDVLTYSYIYDQKPVNVSIQPLDPQLDTGSFRPTRELETSIGHAYLATFDTRT